MIIIYLKLNKLIYSGSIESSGGTGPMKLNNQHSHSNAKVLNPADLFLKDRKRSHIK